MGCGIACIKYLLFIFNFVFALCGLAILIVGVLTHMQLNGFEELDAAGSTPAIALIVVGVVIFVIAFFGCCGAVRESHCMTITFAVCLLTILILQIAIGVWVFIIKKDTATDTTTTEITNTYQTMFNSYWTSDSYRAFIDELQSGSACCGVNGPSDFSSIGNGTVPWSCCGTVTTNTCSVATAHSTGCITIITDLLEKFYTIMGSIAIAVGAIELVGIIFALCLANSIRNDDRRGYRV